MLVLGIETSCDETSAAIVADGKLVLSNVIATQLDLLRKYGGVVPEVAARRHTELIGYVIKEALDTAGKGLVDIYRWLKASTKLSEPKWLSEKMKTMDPAKVISQTALEKKNRLCMKTVNMFVSILGAVAGNLALTGLTTGGVYLGGGISTKILPIWFVALSSPRNKRSGLKSLASLNILLLASSISALLFFLFESIHTF